MLLNLISVYILFSPHCFYKRQKRSHWHNGKKNVSEEWRHKSYRYSKLMFKSTIYKSYTEINRLLYPDFLDTKLFSMTAIVPKIWIFVNILTSRYFYAQNWKWIKHTFWKVDSPTIHLTTRATCRSSLHFSFLLFSHISCLVSLVYSIVRVHFCDGVHVNIMQRACLCCFCLFSWTLGATG